MTVASGVRGEQQRRPGRTALLDDGVVAPEPERIA